MIDELIRKATKHLLNKEFNKALACFRKALHSPDEVEISGYDRFLCTAGIAKAYIGLQDTAQVIASIQDIEKTLDTVGAATVQLEVLKTVADCYYRISHHKDAFEALKRYAEIEDKLYADRMKQQINEINTSFETEKRQYESMNIIDVASRLASIGIIIGGITHEINQPLSAITVNSDSILYWNKKNVGFLPDIITRAAEDMSLSAKKIDGLIKNMRHYWKDTEEAKTELIGLNKVLIKAIELMQGQIDFHNIRLEQLLSTSDPQILCNPIHIEQIVINILVHLLSQSESSQQTDKQIIIKSDTDGGINYFEILDNFSIYSQRPELGSNSYSSVQWDDNISLGLVIVKHAVDRFNGRIVYQKNAESGSTFQIFLTNR